MTINDAMKHLQHLKNAAKNKDNPVVAAIDTVQDFVDANQWIPVSQRLPEKTGSYLTSTDKGFVGYGYYNENAKCFMYTAVGIVASDIIAWRPYPPEYKPKEN